MCAGAAHATGVPGSMDRFLPSYCAVCFGIGTLTSGAKTYQGAWSAGCHANGKEKAAIGVPLATCP